MVVIVHFSPYSSNRSGSSCNEPWIVSRNSSAECRRDVSCRGHVVPIAGSFHSQGGTPKKSKTLTGIVSIDGSWMVNAYGPWWLLMVNDAANNGNTYGVSIHGGSPSFGWLISMGQSHRSTWMMTGGTSMTQESFTPGPRGGWVHDELSNEMTAEHGF